jgi:hypothetical protein
MLNSENFKDIPFVYYGRPDAPEPARHWFDSWFMIPRVGDIIYYDQIWWTVKQVFLRNTEPHLIVVDYYGHD